MLKYIGWQQTCDLFFVLFVVSWVVTRHGIYTYLCYTVIYRITDYIPHRWDPAAGYFLSRNVHYGFIAGLLGLQALLIIWVVAIVRVVYKVASGSEATDTRSECVRLTPQFDLCRRHLTIRTAAKMMTS